MKTLRNKKVKNKSKACKQSSRLRDGEKKQKGVSGRKVGVESFIRDRKEGMDSTLALSSHITVTLEKLRPLRKGYVIKNHPGRLWTRVGGK